MTRNGHRIELTVLQKGRRIPRQKLVRAARAALVEEGAAPARVSLVVMDDAQIATPHQQFLGVSGPTDVISFRYPPGSPEGPDIEVLVSVDHARVEAERRRIPFGQELARYIVHGVLHALGYRDGTETARRRMFRVQERILRKLEGSRPLVRN